MEELNEVDRHKDSGFAVNSWASLASLIVVCVSAIGGVSWGVKLEAKIDKYYEVQMSMRERFVSDLSATQAIISRGILPITEVKIAAIEKRIDSIEKDVDQCVRKSKTLLNFEAMK